MAQLEAAKQVLETRAVRAENELRVQLVGTAPSTMPLGTYELHVAIKKAQQALAGQTSSTAITK